MQISAKKQLSVTVRALLFIGMFFSLFALAHALTIESITIVRVNSAEQSTLTPGSATITADGTSTQVLTVSVKDADGNNMTKGGADVAITKSSGTGSIGSVTDNGNGTFTDSLTGLVWLSDNTCLLRTPVAGISWFAQALDAGVTCAGRHSRPVRGRQHRRRRRAGLP